MFILIKGVPTVRGRGTTRSLLAAALLPHIIERGFLKPRKRNAANSGSGANSTNDHSKSCQSCLRCRACFARRIDEMLRGKCMLASHVGRNFRFLHTVFGATKLLRNGISDAVFETTAIFSLYCFDVCVAGRGESNTEPEKDILHFLVLFDRTRSWRRRHIQPGFRGHYSLRKDATGAPQVRELFS